MRLKFGQQSEIQISAYILCILYTNLLSRKGQIIGNPKS